MSSISPRNVESVGKLSSGYVIRNIVHDHSSVFTLDDWFFHVLKKNSYRWVKGPLEYLIKNGNVYF